MNIVIAPDSFKGCLSAIEVSQALERGVRQVFPTSRIELIPMADGGEGTVDSVLAATEGRKVTVRVNDPLGRPIDAAYGLVDGGQTAILEMAAASGLPLLKEDERNPLVTSTYGTGELIKDALGKGVKKILIGIGGSATNDGGAGMAEALGVRLLDSDGRPLQPGGADLQRLAEIDISGLDPRLKDVEVEIACDVQNPLCGSQGASAVYGPQKGATPEMVKQLDKALLNFGQKLSELTGVDLVNFPGAGAAGGLGGGLVGFLGGRLRPGTEIILEVAHAFEKIRQADLVLTGEGKTDFQTAYGKVPVGVARLAKKVGVPVLVLSGTIEGNPDMLSDYGITACFSVAEGPISLDKALEQASEQLERAAWRVLLLWKAAKHS